MQTTMQLKKNRLWPWYLAIFAMFLLVPMVSYGGYADSIGQGIGWIINFLLIQPFVLLLQVELIILPKIAQYNIFATLPAVSQGWMALRDMSNMFFIVILLLMSFATILKFEAYGYKQVLRKLILMAILINFSKLIVGLVIDFFQLLMLTFVALWKDVAAGNITAALGLDQLMAFKAQDSTTTNSGFFETIGAIVVAYLFAAIFLIMTCIVVFAFIFVLVARIVMFWILIVLSPFAFLANAFPLTQQYFSQWMGALSKELIVGPVLAFFLWLSFTIVGSGNIDQQFTARSAQEGHNIGGISEEEQKKLQPNIGNLTQATEPDSFLKYIVGIAMLIGSLKVTQSIGGVASGVGASAASKAKKVVGAATLGVAAWGGMKMWKGTSGYGGVKGGLQRVTAKVGAGTLGLAGDITGIQGLTRASLGLRQAERNRKMEKRDTMLKDTKGMTEDEQKKYLGRNSIYARGAIDKVDIEEGNLADKSKEEIGLMVSRAEKVNDKDTLNKIRAASAHAHNEKSIAGMMSGKGLGAASGIKVESLTEEDGKTPSQGGAVVADYIFKNYDADQVKKWTENMTKKEQDAWKAAMSAAAQRATTGEKFDFGTMFKKDEDGKQSAELDKDSDAYKAAMLDDKVYASAYAGLQNPNDKKSLAKSKGESTRVEDLPKKKQSDMGDEAYRAMVGNLSAQKASTFISNLSPDDSRVEIVASEQVANRDSGFLDSAALSGVLDAKKRERIAQAGFDKKVQVEVKTSGKTEQVVRVELAKENLRQAHNFFTTPQDFTAFVNTLKAREASQVDRGKLENILGDISVDLREELADSYGIGKKNSPVSTWKDRMKDIK